MSEETGDCLLGGLPGQRHPSRLGFSLGVIDRLLGKRTTTSDSMTSNTWRRNEEGSPQQLLT